MPEIDLLHVGVSVYPPGASFGPYDLAADEIVWVEDGSATLSGPPLPVHVGPGDVVVCGSGHEHVYEWDDDRTTRHGYVRFVARDRPKRSHEVISLADHSLVIALLRHAAWLESFRPDDWTELARLAVSHALLTLDAGLTSGADGGLGTLPVPLERSVGLVAQRWAGGVRLQAPTLRELAKAAGVSPEHLCRLFSIHFGHGPIAALRMVRLSRAAELLARSNMSVKEIARATGFDDEFHFSRAFKRFAGTPPTVFRLSHTGIPRLPAQLEGLASLLKQAGAP